MAERYFAAIEETCALLVTRLAGLRRVPVKGFGNHLLFYMPHSGGIDVVRVLHAARDIDGIFGGEES